MNEFIFETGSVPVRVAARVYGKDASWVTIDVSMIITHKSKNLKNYMEKKHMNV